MQQSSALTGTKLGRSRLSGTPVTARTFRAAPAGRRGRLICRAEKVSLWAAAAPPAVSLGLL